MRPLISLLNDASIACALVSFVPDFLASQAVLISTQLLAAVNKNPYTAIARPKVEQARLSFAESSSMNIQKDSTLNPPPP